MVGFVLLLGVTNVALGYGLAVALADPLFGGRKFRFQRPKFAWPRLARFKLGLPRLRGANAAPEVELPDFGKLEHLSVAEASPTELPRVWQEQLAEADLRPRAFVEAIVHVLRLGVIGYREQLLTAEWRARRMLSEPDAAGLTLLRDDLGAVNAHWLQEQSTAEALLSERRGRLGRYEDLGHALQRLLFEQAGQIRAIGEAAAAAGENDPQVAGKQLLGELARLIDLAHLLRDQVQEMLALILRDERRLEDAAQGIHIDAATGLPNRVGIELLFQQWRESSSENARQASLVLMDVDRFAKLNERLGTRTGDRTLQALGQQLLDLLRKDRGFDRVARAGGQTFLMFLGNTGPHNATCCTERVRQTLEATSFDSEGNQFELSLSCGVVAIGAEEPLSDALKRAVRTVAEAKKQGRNRTAIDEGQGPEFVDPPTYHVRSCTVTVQ